MSRRPGRAVGALRLVVLTLALGACGGAATADDAPPSIGSSELSVARQGWRTDFTRHVVGLDEFASGGPGKDGIPAIDRPRFAPARATTFLRPREPVIELAAGRLARAYPVQILVWHEIVNDVAGGRPIAVTFCPLCNTALAFDRRIDGRTLTFGVSGNLRHSDLVMFDRETESWWQQFGGRALVGRWAGRRLLTLPTRIVAWREFRARHPGGLVLQRPLGRDNLRARADDVSTAGDFLRPYGTNPYAGYDEAGSPPFFEAAHRDDRRLLPKERVVYVRRGGKAVAVAFSLLRRRSVMRLEVAGERLTVRYRPGVASPLDAERVASGRDVGSAEVRDAAGRLIAFDQPFWFAVAAFRPDVRVVR